MYLRRASILRIPKFSMHPISSAQKENILSLASNGHPTCHITSKLGVGRSTISRVFRKLLPNRQIPSSGCYSKLSPTDKQSTSPKSPLERLPMLFRSPNTLTPSSPTQSAHKQSEMCSSSTHSRLLQRRKSHCSLQYTGRSGWPLLSDTRSGLWRTGRG